MSIAYVLTYEIRNIKSAKYISVKIKINLKQIIGRRIALFQNCLLSKE